MDLSFDDIEDTPCWICLEPGGDVTTPCACPRPAHPRCLARWQLQQAGRLEENECRFCRQPYGDWKDQLGGVNLGSGVAPIMAVSVNGRLHKLRVSPGPEGRAQFQEQVCVLLGISGPATFDDQGIDVMFECKVPGSGEKVKLLGFGAFEAAAHCAAVAAARRQARKQDNSGPAAVSASDDRPSAVAYSLQLPLGAPAGSAAHPAHAIPSVVPFTSARPPGERRLSSSAPVNAPRRRRYMEFVEEQPATGAAGTSLDSWLDESVREYARTLGRRARSVEGLLEFTGLDDIMPTDGAASGSSPRSGAGTAGGFGTPAGTATLSTLWSGPSAAGPVACPAAAGRAGWAPVSVTGSSPPAANRDQTPPLGVDKAHSGRGRIARTVSRLLRLPAA